MGTGTRWWRGGVVSSVVDQTGRYEVILMYLEAQTSIHTFNLMLIREHKL